MTLSVLVVTYANADHIAQTLTAVREQLRDGDELIVIDNASPDGTAAAVEQAAPNARLIRAEHNLGFAAGANRAAAQAGGDVLLLLNPDCVPEAGALEAIRAGAARWDVWQGLVLYPDGETVNTAGGEVHELGFGWAGRCDEPRLQGDRPRPVGFASGACLAIRRHDWERLGGFPEEFFMYCEDVDLALRARLAGLRVGIEPAAVVRHDYAFGKGARKWRALERNRWLTVLRCYPGPLLALLMPALLAAEAGLLIAAARQGWLRAKLGAQADVLRSLPRVLAERRAIQRARTIGSREFHAALRPLLESPYAGALPSLRPVAVLLRLHWRIVDRLTSAF